MPKTKLPKAVVRAANIYPDGEFWVAADRRTGVRRHRLEVREPGVETHWVAVIPCATKHAATQIAYQFNGPYPTAST